MFSKIMDYFKSLCEYHVTLIDVDESSKTVCFSENGACLKVAFGDLSRFYRFLPHMANVDIVRFAYCLRMYSEKKLKKPRVCNDITENTICIEAEGRGGTVICFDAATMGKTHFLVKKLVNNKALVNRLTQLGAYRLGVMHAELTALGLKAQQPAMGHAQLRAVN